MVVLSLDVKVEDSVVRKNCIKEKDRRDGKGFFSFAVLIVKDKIVDRLRFKTIKSEYSKF